MFQLNLAKKMNYGTGTIFSHTSSKLHIMELSCEPHEIVITVEESLLSNHFTILRDKGL